MSEQFPIQARPAITTISSSLIRDVANTAMGRTDILPFWFGESDRPTPDFIREAATKSIDRGETFYSQNLGRPYLRQAIAEYLSALHGRLIDMEQIAVVGSGVSALMTIAQLLLSPGDKVICVTPLWPNVCEIPRILGAQVERVSLEVSGGQWSLDVDRLIAALEPGTRAIVINSPNNPTGWTIDEISIRAILTHCRRHGIWIISDDVYERLTYDATSRSAPSFQMFCEATDRVISINSFSKAWSMTGWRIGWILAPKALAGDIAKVIEYNSSCVFEPIQRAATVAITDGEAEVLNFRREVIATRLLLQESLKGLGSVVVPDAGGAMYVFFRIQGITDTTRFAKALIRQVGLGLAPGAAFGPEGQGWLRWCHAVDPNKLQAGVDRLKSYLSSRPHG